MSYKWFSSDYHFYHFNIIKYCNRPFQNLVEMHETIIERHNERVGKNDLVYMLGDLSFYSGKLIPLLTKMRGKKIILKGNHDPKNIVRLLNFPDTGVIEIVDYKEISVKGRLFVLMHYPIESWKGKNRGSIHLHGHTHSLPEYRSNLEDLTPVNFDFNTKNRRFNVGVDLNDFFPVSLEEVIGKFK